MNQSLPFKNKIALITGSGRGIGREIALHFARLGADIVINFFRNRIPAEKTFEEVRQLNRRSLLIKANIGEIEEINLLFNQIENYFGGLDFLIHNAASGFNRPVLEQKLRGWEWTMNINARSLLFSAQQAARLMEPRGGGAIVSISSPGSKFVLPDYAVVGASKAVIETLTRYLAVELAEKNIVVNAISPGIVLTDALKHFDVARKNSNIIEHALANSPAGRLVTPQDVAYLVAFLCTPMAEMIRGQTIIVDGGATLLPSTTFRDLDMDE